MQFVETSGVEGMASGGDGVSVVGGMSKKGVGERRDFGVETLGS